MMLRQKHHRSLLSLPSCCGRKLFLRMMSWRTCIPDVPRDMRMRLWKNAMRQAGVPIPKPENDGAPSEEELERALPHRAALMHV